MAKHGDSQTVEKKRIDFALFLCGKMKKNVEKMQFFCKLSWPNDSSYKHAVCGIESSSEFSFQPFKSHLSSLCHLELTVKGMRPLNPLNPLIPPHISSMNARERQFWLTLMISMSSSVSRRAILVWRSVATQKWSSKQKLTNRQNEKATTKVHGLNNNIEPDRINDTISRVRLGRCSNAQQGQELTNGCVQELFQSCSRVVPELSRVAQSCSDLR